jgi:hypothetical protein
MTQHDQLVEKVAKAVRDYDTNADWSRKTFEGMARAALAVVRHELSDDITLIIEMIHAGPHSPVWDSVRSVRRLFPEAEDHGAQGVAEGGEK